MADRSYNSSRDRINSPSSRSPQSKRPTPLELRQGINSPNVSPQLKREMLSQIRTEKKGGESKFSKGTVIMIMSAAIFFDVLQWLILLVAGEYVVGEVINDVIDPVIQLLFATWYKFLGIKLMGLETFLTITGNFIGKEITQGVLPLWSLEVGLVIFFTKSKETAENLVPGASKAVEQLSSKKVA